MAGRIYFLLLESYWILIFLLLESYTKLKVYDTIVVVG